MSLDKEKALAPTRSRQKVCNKSKNTKWSREEDDYFTKLMATNASQNWTEIVAHFPGKTAQQVSERWEKVLNPVLVKGSWTREEDETIIEFVRQHGNKNWTKLAALLPGRIGKQCRERWRNHLDPEVNRNPWTQEEDSLLIDLHDKMGNQWVKIAEHIPGRSDNSVKNRWNSTLKKRLEYSKDGVIRPRRGRPLISSLPKSADDVPKPPRFEEIIPEMKANSPNLTILNPLYSPYMSLKSPFAGCSPLGIDRMASNSGWSPYRDMGPYDGLGALSPQLFSPSMTENRLGSMNLMSPLLKK